MASVGFCSTVAPATPAAVRPAWSGWRRATSVHVPAATKSVVAAKEEKGFFDFVFGALYKEEQLLETDPLLNKVVEKAAASGTVSRKPDSAAKNAAAGDGDGGGGFNLGGLFAKKG